MKVFFSEQVRATGYDSGRTAQLTDLYDVVLAEVSIQDQGAMQWAAGGSEWELSFAFTLGAEASYKFKVA